MPTPAWVSVYIGKAADAAMLYSLLDAEEIPARVGDELQGTSGVAVSVFVPEDRAEDAEGVVAEFEQDPTAREGAARFQPWICPSCHEHNDGTFDICWNCQANRE